ncbi:uncharacterized protein LOC127780053 [Oryza glaberrima]|uniref:Uncharacterized protein n=1 Tax=Oryza barthii TaxID=65489 RepID=A0A0D3GM74_9ORYZ|nr:uncharacterized protein LOC127780053 [Oryza glaberrima]
MSYRSLLHKRILPAAAAAAAGAALRRPAAGSRLLQARLHQGNGRQRSSSAFLDAGFRDSEKDIDREIEQLAQKFEENSKRWKQEREELDNLRRLDLEEIEECRERTQKILDVATGISAGFFLVGIASYNNLI